VRVEINILQDTFLLVAKEKKNTSTKKTMACNGDFTNFNGCHGFCLFRPYTLEMSEFFETHECNNPIPTTATLYPAMCEQHASLMGLDKQWEEMPGVFRDIVYYVNNPETCPMILFEIFIMSQHIPWKVVSKVLLDPLCFWIIDEQHFAVVILFGYRFLGCTALREGNDRVLDENEHFSYVYVVDAIGQILGWISNGQEDIVSLQLSAEELVAIKWLKISQLVVYGFMLCFGANGMPRQLPNFIPEWQDAWRTRFKHWMEIHSSQVNVDQMWYHFEELIERVRACAIYAFAKPLDPTADQALEARLTEYEHMLGIQE
jgi:hypothetical protein